MTLDTELAAPFAGIVRLHKRAGDLVTPGDAIATIEATKLEAPVIARVGARVVAVHVEDFADVHGGQPLVTLEPPADSATGQSVAPEGEE